MISRGDKIKGYEIEEELGSGGFGDVYRVRDQRSGQRFALKLTKASLSRSRDWTMIRQNFINEIVTLAKLQSHRSIACVYRTIQVNDREGERLGLIMDFVQGVSLDRYAYSQGKVLLDNALPLFLQTLDAVAFAHQQGVLHRDIKPHNIMVLTGERISYQGYQTNPIKILDFGLAKNFEGSFAVESFSGGSLPYMPPERFIPGAHIDVRSDIYSLGATFYEMLTGNLPLNIPSLAEAKHIVTMQKPRPIRAYYEYYPQWLDDVIGRALAKDSSRRYPNCAMFKEALARHPLLGAGAQPRQQSPAPSINSRSVRHSQQPPHSQRVSAGELINDHNLGSARRHSRRDASAAWPSNVPDEARDTYDVPLPGASNAKLDRLLGKWFRISGQFTSVRGRFEPAPIGRRLFATLVDVAAVWSFYIVSLPLAGSIASWRLTLAFPLFAFPLSEFVWSASLGKRVLGLRVYPLSSTKAHMFGIFCRFLVKYPIAVAFFLVCLQYPLIKPDLSDYFYIITVIQTCAWIINLIFVFNTPGKLAFHDLILRTIVIRLS